MERADISQSLLDDGQNAQAVKCQRCPSVILNPKTGKHSRKEIYLPHMKKKSNTQNPEDGEMLSDFWVVDNMFAFENVGFSNTVGTIKYLICADCEVGPIGWHDTTVKNEFYIALDRVTHGLPGQDG